MKKTLRRFAFLTASAAVVLGSTTGVAAAYDWKFYAKYLNEPACLAASGYVGSADLATKCVYTQEDGWYMFIRSIGN
ncbi:hypothetical protein [Amycolatopsis xylanica]|nr:hypothetical protein [Amycolatopsis xylanica]